MSTITPSPIGPATTAKRGTMSAADKTKLDALPANATLEARLLAIEGVDTTQSGNITTLQGQVTTLQGQAHAAVTVSSPTGWLSLAAQALTFALVSASQTVAGVVDLAAQTFAGVKTFVAEAVFAAGILSTGVRATAASLLLRSDLGAGATDKCVVDGTSVADGSVHASAKVWVAATGIGGTQVDKAWVDKAGNLRQVAGGFFRGSSASNGYVDCNDTTGTTVRHGNSQLDLVGGDFFFLYPGNWYGVKILKEGLINQRGTDSTGTPGAATIAKPCGKSSIAAGAASVVITNSLVTAGMRCLFSPHARDATCKELIAVCGAGIITVSGSAAATADLPFSWEVSTII